MPHTRSNRPAPSQWCPKIAVDRSECLNRIKQYYVDPSRRVSLGVEEQLRCMQRSLDELPRIAKELLDTSPPPRVPQWAVRALGDTDMESFGSDPNGSNPSAENGEVDPLEAYATEALGCANIEAVGMAVRQWIEWAQASVELQRGRKRARSSNDGDDDSQVVNRDAADACEDDEDGPIPQLRNEVDVAAAPVVAHAVGVDSGDETDGENDMGTPASTLSRSEWTDLLVSLVMHKWASLRNGTETASGAPNVVVVRNDTNPPVACASECISVGLSQRMVTDHLKAVVRALKAAVLRERHVVQRFASDGLNNMVAYHAKERPNSMQGGEASIPLINATRQQHGALIAARDALAAAQHRFNEAQRLALVAMEDAAAAADAITMQEGRMLSLLEGAVTECNAVDEIRQVLLKEVKALKNALRVGGPVSQQ